MKTQNMLKAYQTVVESQCEKMMIADEDEEESTSRVLSDIAEGLRDILNKIEGHISKPSRLRNSVKTLKIPNEPEGSSWLPSLK